MDKSLYVNIACDWLQVIRMVHALSESAYSIVIPKQIAPRFSYLAKYVGMQFQLGNSGGMLLSDFTRVSHMEPITSIGRISRPLIFPRAIAEKCRTLWRSTRDHRFTFAGLLSSERATTLSEWVIRNTGGIIPELDLASPYEWLPSRLRCLIPSRPNCIEWRAGDFLLWSSNRGRQFPGKTWDEAYYALLSNSQFVLCPKGDCIWSYRFFEAVLCGAIPIIEENCPAFDGFYFKRFGDEIAGLEWSDDLARHNYDLCIERITVPRDALDREIGHLLSGIG